MASEAEEHTVLPCARLSPLRIGYGYDLHRLEEGQSLVLGGVKFPQASGCAGHSDVDAVYHSVVDAILGALSLPDMEQLFANSNPCFKNCSSDIFMTASYERMNLAGFRLGNIDVTVILEKSKISPHKENMRKNIAKLLCAPFDVVNVKAKTREIVSAVEVHTVVALLRNGNESPPAVQNVTSVETEDSKGTENSIDSVNDEHQISKKEETITEPMHYKQADTILFRFPPRGNGSITVKYEDYLRLEANEYLNDTLIDFYLKIIEERQAAMAAASNGDETRVYFFTSFFFGRLRQAKDAPLADIQYDGVKRWTKNVDLFRKELSFMPVCESSHWSLIILANMDELEKCMEEDKYIYSLCETKRPRILYLDSLEPRRGTSFGKIMLHYLSAEYTERKSEHPSAEERKAKFEKMKEVISVNYPYVPMQVNEVDCGLYLLHNINCFLDESTGMKRACLSDIKGDEKCKQPWMKTLYSHVEVDLLRAEMLDLMQQLEEGNKTDGGNAPNMHLCIPRYSDDVASEDENVGADGDNSRDESKVGDDGDDEPKVISQEMKQVIPEDDIKDASAIAAAIEPPRSQREESLQRRDNEDEVVLVEGKAKYVRVKPPQERTNSVAADIRPHRRHTAPGSSSATIPPNMAYGSSEPIRPSRIIANNYRTRMEAEGHQIQRTGSRRHKSMPFRRSEQTSKEKDPMEVVGIDDNDVEMQDSRDKKGTPAREVIDLMDTDGDVKMVE